MCDSKDMIKEKAEIVDSQLEKITQQITTLQNQLQHANSVRFQLLGAKSILKELADTQDDVSDGIEE